jgi:hypothetical protein
MIEVQVAPIRPSVHIPVATLWAHFQGGDVEKALGELLTPAKTMLDDLLWWTNALKSSRTNVYDSPECESQNRVGSPLRSAFNGTVLHQHGE